MSMYGFRLKNGDKWPLVTDGVKNAWTPDSPDGPPGHEETTADGLILYCHEGEWGIVCADLFGFDDEYLYPSEWVPVKREWVDDGFKWRDVDPRLIEAWTHNYAYGFPMIREAFEATPSVTQSASSAPSNPTPAPVPHREEGGA